MFSISLICLRSALGNVIEKLADKAGKSSQRKQVPTDSIFGQAMGKAKPNVFD